MDLVELVDGVKLYSVKKIECYVFLFRESRGICSGLSFEKRESGFQLVMALSQENLPIVIGNPAYQHQGIGCKVLKL